MPIRRRFNKPKIIRYHRWYGSVSNPPLLDQGTHGKAWPNGSAVSSLDVPGYHGRHILIGWVCYQIGVKTFGLWICTRIGTTVQADMPGKRKLPLLDSKWASDGEYKFVGQYPEAMHHARIMDKLLEAFGDHHELLM